MHPPEKHERDAWDILRAGPTVDFPRGPAAGSALAWRPRILVFLLLACLIPRAIAAWRWDVLWGDTIHYQYASLALEQGNFDEGFAEFGLNIYPLILIPLRHLGVDWQIAGKCFSVLVASLTVVPLWGWLRRMFDDRLAVIGCLVYALHGKLIAISALIIRDSTFWFLLALCLYYLWRAAGESRTGFFLAAGAALTLAIHTRTEGWLLLVPLLGWVACRWRSPFAGQRIRLAVGALLCIAVIPAAVTAVNVTWLRDHPRWEFLRVAHLQMAVGWWNAASGMHVRLPYEEGERLEKNPFLQTTPPRLAATVPIATTGAATAPAAQPATQPSPQPFPSLLVPTVTPVEQSAPGWLLTFKLLERVAKACTWVGSFLLLVGVVCGWRIFLRPEHLTLFGMSLLLLAISRIRYWAGGLDLRYFMPLVIVGVPWMALGMEHILAGALRLFQRHGARAPRALCALVGGLIAVAVTCSFLDGPMAAASLMRKHAALGRWIYHRAGPEPAIVGNLDYLSLDTFYANGRVVGIFSPHDRSTAPMPDALTARQADVVVLWNEDNLARDRLASVERRITDQCGYCRVDARELPAGENELMVFVRGRP